MASPTENENWIIEKGDEIIKKKAMGGVDSLSNWERVVYCLWVADYGMRNAGDLRSASDVYAAYKTDGLKSSSIIGLKLSKEFFSKDEQSLQKEYFNLFEGVCSELKSAERST